jgi:hypothetical protein
MLAGLCALFYLHQRRVLVFLRSTDAGGTRVEAGGWSSRGDQEFEPEFQRFFSGLVPAPVPAARGEMPETLPGLS